MAPRATKRNGHENEDVAGKKTRGTSGGAKLAEGEGADHSDDDRTSGTLSDVLVEEVTEADKEVAVGDGRANVNDNDENMITLSTRDYFEEELVTRLNTLNAYRNDATGCATLRTVPFQKLGWGSISGGRNTRAENLYCNGSLFSLWIIGELTARSFVKQGLNVRRPTVRVKPLLGQDLLNARRLIGSMAKPAHQAEFDPEGLWASKWMGDQTMADDAIPAFERCYDATDLYQKKSEMPRVYPPSLKRGDIVLLEVFVTRWIPKDDANDNPVATTSAVGKGKGVQASTKGRYAPKEWKKWNVQFVLDAVSLLFKGSDYYVEQAKADEEVEL